MSTPTLRRSTDRKVANALNPAGTRPTIANAFGLPSGLAYSCPGATGVCGSVCYAGKLERIYSGVRTVLLHNWETLQGMSKPAMVRALSAMVSEFVEESTRRGAPLLFRIHWDGDFYSGPYTAAWVAVIRQFPAVQFWAYTRNGGAAITLTRARLDNLALYFSADRDNIETARGLRDRYGVRLAYLGENFATAREGLREITGRHGAMCPENLGRIPLASRDGSACVRCGICIKGRSDVLFSASKH